LLENSKISAKSAVNEGFLERLSKVVAERGGAAAVSRLSGISESTLSNYLSGTEPRFTRIAAIASACQVSLDWLATGRGTLNGASGTAFPGFDASMAEPANFYQLCMLVWHCQDYFLGIEHTPSLADVFQWVSPLYPSIAKYPDRKFKVIVDEPLS